LKEGQEKSNRGKGFDWREEREKGLERRAGKVNEGRKGKVNWGEGWAKS
jgi:hypothetical protein